MLFVTDRQWMNEWIWKCCGCRFCFNIRFLLVFFECPKSLVKRIKRGKTMCPFCFENRLNQIDGHVVPWFEIQNENKSNVETKIIMFVWRQNRSIGSISYFGLNSWHFRFMIRQMDEWRSNYLNWNNFSERKMEMEVCDVMHKVTILDS